MMSSPGPSSSKRLDEPIEQKVLTCVSSKTFDPAKHCICCCEPQKKQRKLTTTENGMKKIKEVCFFQHFL